MAVKPVRHAVEEVADARTERARSLRKRLRRADCAGSSLSRALSRGRRTTARERRWTRKRVDEDERRGEERLRACGRGRAARALDCGGGAPPAAVRRHGRLVFGLCRALLRDHQRRRARRSRRSSRRTGRCSVALRRARRPRGSRRSRATSAARGSRSGWRRRPLSGSGSTSSDSGSSGTGKSDYVGSSGSDSSAPSRPTRAAVARTRADRARPAPVRRAATTDDAREPLRVHRWDGAERPQRRLPAHVRQVTERPPAPPSAGPRC